MATNSGVDFTNYGSDTNIYNMIQNLTEMVKHLEKKKHNFAWIVDTDKR